MAWNERTKSELWNMVLSVMKKFDNCIVVIRNETPRAVLGLPGAQDQIDRAKIQMSIAIEEMQHFSSYIPKMIQYMLNSSSTIKNEIASGEKRVKSLNDDVREAEVLREIRLEQATVLKKKYGSNLHSSWLGLWRPLGEQSRFGILIAAIAFGCIAIVSIAYLVWNRTSTPVMNSMSAAIKTDGLFGGARRLFRALH